MIKYKNSPQFVLSTETTLLFIKKILIDEEIPPLPSIFDAKRYFKERNLEKKNGWWKGKVESVRRRKEGNLCTTTDARRK